MKKDLPIIFVSGFPRSGSTLLMNILGQNKNNFVTPTNSLCGLNNYIRNVWKNMDGFKAQGFDKSQPRVENYIKYGMYGFYENEFDSDKIVFDKSRAWLTQIDLLEQVLGREIKIIVTIREVKDIITSFEKMYKKNSMGINIPIEPNDTVYERAKKLLNDTSLVGSHINSFREVINSDKSDRLFILPYNRLTKESKFSMEYLHKELNLDPFEYDFDNIEQVTYENDDVHAGLHELHKIRKKVEFKDSESEQYLNNNLIEWIQSEFQDIDNFAKG